MKSHSAMVMCFPHSSCLRRANLEAIKRCFIFSKNSLNFQFQGAIERFFLLELEETEEKELLPLYNEANVSNCATLLCRTKNLSPVSIPPESTREHPYPPKVLYVGADHPYDLLGHDFPPVEI